MRVLPRVSARFLFAIVATIACLGPRTTNADDDAWRWAPAPGQARLDDMLAQARIEHASAGPRGWVMRVTCSNTTKERLTKTLALAANVSVFVPASRSGTTPVAAWTKRPVVTLAPGETATLAFPLPESLGARMTKWEAEGRAIQKAYADVASGRAAALPSWAVGIGAGPRGTVTAIVGADG